MAIDTRTIAELQAQAFTHIEAVCSRCGNIVRMPFRLLLARGGVTAAITAAELRARYRCSRCRCGQANSFGPWAAR